MKHVLYETGDKDAPDQIKDSNGEVALGLCKVCGGAEAALPTDCPGRKLTSEEMEGRMTGKWDYTDPDPSLLGVYNLMTDEDREQLRNGVIPQQVAAAMQETLNETYTKMHGDGTSAADLLHRDLCLHYCWAEFRLTLLSLATSFSSPS